LQVGDELWVVKVTVGESHDVGAATYVVGIVDCPVTGAITELNVIPLELTEETVLGMVLVVVVVVGTS
jgi:hypothetical protein